MMSENAETEQKRLTVRLSGDEYAAVEDLAARRHMSVNSVFKKLVRLTSLLEVELQAQDAREH